MPPPDLWRSGRRHRQNHPRAAPRPRPTFFPIWIAASLFYYGVFESALRSATGAGLIWVFAVYLLVLRFWTADPIPNVRLLVLRVFGVDRNANLTFGRLLEHWQHFGNYFTVVDPSYLKHHFRFASPRTIVVALTLWGLTAGLYYPTSDFVYESFVQYLDFERQDAFSLVDRFYVWIWYSGLGWSALLAALAVISVEFRLIDRRMVRSRDELRNRLARLAARPRNYAQSFKAMPTPCYDDTWRMAVAEFVRASDVVLMDLRGFSDARKGCEYEVDFLFDTFPAARILFLIDEEVDRELIERLVHERWKHLRMGSPNLGIEDPQVLIYVARRQDEADVQNILDHLIGMAARSDRLAVPVGGSNTELAPHLEPEG